MNARLDDEEVGALRELAGEGAEPPPEVASRDFAEPRRLGGERLAALGRRLSTAIRPLENALAATLGERFSFDLDGVREVGAEGILASLPRPLTAARFDAGGQPGWIAWQNEAALLAIEQVLGVSSGGAAPLARPFSSVERAVLQGLFTAVLQPVLASLGRAGGAPKVVTDPADFGSWKDGGDGADAHRVCVSLAFQGPGIESAFHLYLPGFQPARAGAREQGPALAADAPPHLRAMRLGVTALLGGAELPLGDLRSLEVGDVIPLDVAVDGLVQLRVGDRPIAGGRLGTRAGRLAVLIQSLRVDDETA